MNKKGETVISGSRSSTLSGLPLTRLAREVMDEEEPEARERAGSGEGARSNFVAPGSVEAR